MLILAPLDPRSGTETVIDSLCIFLGTCSQSVFSITYPSTSLWFVDQSELILDISLLVSKGLGRFTSKATISLSAICVSFYLIAAPWHC